MEVERLKIRWNLHFQSTNCIFLHWFLPCRLFLKILTTISFSWNPSLPHSTEPRLTFLFVTWLLVSIFLFEPFLWAFGWRQNQSQIASLFQTFNPFFSARILAWGFFCHNLILISFVKQIFLYSDGFRRQLYFN